MRITIKVYKVNNKICFSDELKADFFEEPMILDQWLSSARIRVSRHLADMGIPQRPNYAYATYEVSKENGILVSKKVSIAKSLLDFSVEEIKIRVHSCLGYNGEMTRARKHFVPRQLVYALCRIFTDKKLHELFLLYNQDHGTIVHAVKDAGDAIRTKDTYFLSCLDKVQEEFGVDWLREKILTLKADSRYN